MISISSNNKLLQKQEPLVMGILNLTPDSFYVGSRANDIDLILSGVEEWIGEGMDILDIGAVSTRPGAATIDYEEECRRITETLNEIRQRFPDLWISIDTTSAKVAEQCLRTGADIVNDISAGENDPDMFKVVAEHRAPYIIMHKQGTPENMQLAPSYTNVVKDVFEYLKNRIGLCREAGIEELIIDPGFGFGKSIDHNYELLQKLHVFKMFDLPILVGLSRKSMIYRLLDVDPEEALNGTTVLQAHALRQGVDILRVHDIREAKESIILNEKLNTIFS